MRITPIASAGLEAVVSRYMALDPFAMAQIELLQGNVIAFDILGLGLTLYLQPEPGRLRILPEYAGEPDCRIKGTPIALTRMSNPEQRTGQLFSGDVEITGDTELAHRFGKILNAMDIDWEEQLSHFTGDIIAHQTGNLLRQAAGWKAYATDTAAKDLQEYLQEELRLLPVKAELDPFLTAVDDLRDHIERLQARLTRLQNRLQGKYP